MGDSSKDRHRFDGIYDAIPDNALEVMERSALSCAGITLPVRSYRRGTCARYATSKIDGPYYVDRPFKGSGGGAVGLLCKEYGISASELSRAYGTPETSKRPDVVTRQTVSRWVRGQDEGMNLPCIVRLAVTFMAIILSKRADNLACDLGDLASDTVESDEAAGELCGCFIQFAGEMSNEATWREARDKEKEAMRAVVNRAVSQLDYERLFVLAMNARSLMGEMGDKNVRPLISTTWDYRLFD